MYKWKSNVRSVIPYTPGEQPQIADIVKLNTNENPYPPAPGVKAAIEQFDESLLRKYPDPNVTGLVKAIAKAHSVNDNQVFTGVGSDDVIAMAFLTFFNSEKPILFPDITYSFYDVWANLFKIPFNTPKLDENFKIVPSDYCVPNGGIIFANPNAPTSIELPISQVESIIKANQDVVVIIDEAYVDFGGTSVLPLIDKYDNLLVVRTFSKSRSMAGMRIGYAIGNPELISAMNCVKHSYNSYTMNQVTIASGIASVEDEAYFNTTRQKIIATRENYREELSKLGFTSLESKTNFLFATHEAMKASEIFKKLKERRIFVRYFNKPRIDNYLRITIGTDEEMEKLMAALREILS
jgi:histidinol-phosphate aminotransferase